MNLKDKLNRVREYVAPQPRRDDAPPEQTPAAGTFIEAAPPADPSPGPAVGPGDDDEKTIFETDPATLDQIRALTADWKQESGAATPVAPATPAPVAPAPTAPVFATRADAPNTEDIRVDLSNFLPLRADGTVDFEAVYGRAGLRAPAFGAEQMRQIISELPAEMPDEMKRQTVAVMANAMARHLGATPETIAQDAARKSAALASFASEYETKLKETTAGVEAEIASLEALIEEKKRTLSGTGERLAQVRSQCEGEAVKLDEVLTYLNVPRPDAPVEKIPTGDPSATSDAANSWENAPSVELHGAGAAPAGDVEEEDEEDTADTIER
jgi:hypothetical protein